MKQAIQLTMENLVDIVSEVRNITLDMLTSKIFDGYKWVVAEKTDTGMFVDFLKDATFHRDYQLRPLPESLKDLRLDIWQPVVHRDAVPEEGVKYVINYFGGGDRLLTKTLDTRQAALQIWDIWSDDPIMGCVSLQKIETIRRTQ